MTGTGYTSCTQRSNPPYAGIPHRDAQAATPTFIRSGTFDTNLARNGEGERVGMELMRHSDPRLTSLTYTDASQRPTVDAVKNLPSFQNPQPAPTAKSSDLPSDLKPLAENRESLPQSVKEALLAIAQAARK